MTLPLYLRGGRVTIVLGVCAALGLVATPSAQATTTTLGYTGGEQLFVVPAGVTSIHVVAIGGSGGAASGGAAARRRR